MLRAIVGRVLSIVPLLLLVTMVTFALGELMPGDQAQAIAGDTATPEMVEAIRADLNLDDPAPVRYVRWLGDAVTGDLGQSTTSRRPVVDEIKRRFPVTAQLAFVSLGISALIGLPIGLIQGLKPGGKVDKVLLGVVSLSMATPGFWLATMAVFLFSVKLGWLPAIGYVPFSESPTEWAKHMVLPATTLSILGIGVVARFLRTSLVGVMQEDFIRAARSGGLPSRSVLGRHALRNAATPVVTVLGLRVASLLAGSVLIEEIFALPGLGVYAVRAVQLRDFVVVQSVILAIGLIVILVNLITDIAYIWLNPKVRIS